MAKHNVPSAYKDTRLRFSKLAILSTCLVFGALLGAIANLIVAFVSSSASLYSKLPSGAIGISKNGFFIDYQATLNLDAVISFLTSGAVLGVAIGAVIAVILCITHSISEKRRNFKDADVRESLEPVRHIVTDGSATVVRKIPSTKEEGKRRRGTLLLTTTTLEFYNHDYTRSEKNFLLKLTDVISVKAKGGIFSIDKIIITTSKASYVFRVPEGTAFVWKQRISREAELACKQ